MTRIALVVLDTLRKEAFDRHFEWLPGRRFERAFSTANWTVPAHASLFTGRYASEVGVHAKHTHFNCEERALAERLREAGYTTHAFSANTNITGHFEFDRGFDDFRTPGRFDHLSEDGLFNWREFSRTTSATGAARYARGVYECVRDREVDTVASLLDGLKLKLDDDRGVDYGGTREAHEELDSMAFGDRAFLFLNLMEAHEPYVAPPEYTSVEEPDSIDAVGDLSFGSPNGDDVRRAYDDCARYLSDAYRELFADLRAEFDYVVTLADHGELLGEADAWGHEHGVHPALTHVPLVVSGDGLDGVCEAPVSLLDIHDTVLSLADVEGPRRNQVLTGDVSGGEYLTEYRGLTTWSEEQLAESGHADRVDAYDEPLEGYLAPEDYYCYETVDGVVETGESARDDPLDRMAALAEARQIKSVRGDTEVPEEIQDRLEHLGYA